MANEKQLGRSLVHPPRLLVWRVAVRDRYVYTASAHSILYFFSGGAARNLVSVPGYSPEAFGRGRVYARTRREVFATAFRTLKDLTCHLDQQLFVAVNRGIIANARHIAILDFDPSQRRAGFYLRDGNHEWIPIGASCLGSLRRHFGLPARNNSLAVSHSEANRSSRPLAAVAPRIQKLG